MKPRDEITKEVIEIFTKRNLSANTADLFCAITEISKMIEVEQDLVRDEVNEAWIAAAPQLLSKDDATRLIEAMVGGFTEPAM